MVVEGVPGVGPAGRFAVTRRDVLKGVLGATLGLSVGGGPLLFAADAPADPSLPKPNIVVVILDALRAKSLPMYGLPRNTAPFLQKLASQSTLYTRCYSSATWTKPAVTGIFTGLTPSEHRSFIVQQPLPPETPTISRLLKSIGYQTGYIQSNPFVSKYYGMDKHFDYVSFEASETYSGETVLQETEKWFKTLKSGPVFAYVHFMQPHAPYNPPEHFIKEIEEEARQFPPDGSYLRPDYHEVDAAAADYNILGRIMFNAAQLINSKDPLTYLLRYEANIKYGDSHASNLFAMWNKYRAGERTIFIITGDHGECVGEKGLFCDHGKLLTNSILHVPLIIHDTAKPAKGEVTFPVSHLDLGTTILAACGSAETLGPYGRNIYPYPGGERPDARVVISGVSPIGEGAPPTGEGGWALTRGPWKLVFNDAPTYGNHSLLDVYCTPDPNPSSEIVILPTPKTILRAEKTLKTGTTIKDFGLHTPHAEQGKEIQFSGRAIHPDGSKGVLRFRLVLQEKPALEIGEFNCESKITEFQGKFTAAASGSETRYGTIQAVWKTASGDNAGAPPSDAGWEPILTFPLLVPRAISDEIELVGVRSIPAIAAPGEDVSLRFVWRCTRTPKASITVRIELRDAKGSVVWDEKHRFYEGLMSSAGAADTLGKLFRPGHRFRESVPIGLEDDIAPGDYEIYVGVLGQEKLVLAGKLKIAPDVASASKLMLEQRLDSDHFAPILAQFSEPATKRADLGLVLKELAANHEDEGHFSYLLGQISEDPEARKTQLLDCLKKVPNHLGALSQAAKERWGIAFVKPLRAITPERVCNIIFDEMIRLYGYDIKISAANRDEVILKLYWECLAPIDSSLAVDLSNGSGNTIMWLVGGNTRPTHTWKIGEAVVETLRVNVSNRGTRIRDSSWVYFHSEVKGDQWGKIELVSGTLRFSASPPDVGHPPSMKLPLEVGSHRFTGQLNLNDACPHPTYLEFWLESPGIPEQLVKKIIIRPTQTIVVNEEIEIKHPQSMLTLRYTTEGTAEKAIYYTDAYLESLLLESRVRGYSILDTKSLFENASYVTTDYPGNPAFRRVALEQQNQLMMIAWPTGQHDPTRIHIPLGPGQCEFTALALLRKECPVPTVLSCRLREPNGLESELATISLKPGQEAPLSLSFVVRRPSSELVIRYTTEAGSPDYTNLYLSNAKLMRIPEKYVREDAKSLAARGLKTEKEGSASPRPKKLDVRNYTTLALLRDPSSKTRTEARFPVNEGRHLLTATAKSIQQGDANATLEVYAVETSGRRIAIRSAVLKSGEALPLNESFETQSRWSELVLVYSMDGGKEISENSSLELERVSLETKSDELIPSKEVALGLRLYPFWEYMYGGLATKSYLHCLNDKGLETAQADLLPVATADLLTSDEDWVQRKLGEKKNYRLYNVIEDPYEKENVLESHPEVFEDLRRELTILKTKTQAKAAAKAEENPNSTNGIDPKDVQRLRALGYLK